ncbi:MAG: Selenocysteine-specific elongation factor [Chloroflexota bacterium]|nr:MAG: Selenocysteine-specific elongation factor [Chloroflexota bacterium]
MKEQISNYLNQFETITVAEARTLFDSSRKYILPLLEHLDNQKITARDGDFRRLIKQ